MRSRSDRIRHAISFEIIGLMLITPLGAWAFDMPAAGIGVIAVVTAIAAALWTYVYNFRFDQILRRFTGSTAKTVPLRVLHAVLYEAGLVAALLPFITWYLGIGVLAALLMDGSFSLFYVVYAFVFNWTYDRIFPIPAWQHVDRNEA